MVLKPTEIMDKKLTFTIENIKQAINAALKTSKRVDVDFSECRIGAVWKDAKLHHYVNKVGNVTFEDKVLGYDRASEHVEKAAKALGLVVSKRKAFLDSGRTDIFRCPIYNEVEIITSIVRLQESKAFTKLNKWLIKQGLPTIGLTDMYIADNCRKRSDDSLSNVNYMAENETYCTNILEWLRANKTGRDTISMEMEKTDEFEDCNRGNYESERYGTQYTFPHFVIKTPKGKIKAESTSRYSFTLR